MRHQHFKSPQNVNIIIQPKHNTVLSQVTPKIFSYARLEAAVVLATIIKGTVSTTQSRTSTSLMSRTEVAAIVPVVWKIGMLVMKFK